MTEPSALSLRTLVGMQPHKNFIHLVINIFLMSAKDKAELSHFVLIAFKTI
jgi:hypothetical protein